MYTGDRFISQRDNSGHDSASIFAIKCELFPTAFDRTSKLSNNQESKTKATVNQNTKAFQAILQHEVLGV